MSRKSLVLTGQQSGKPVDRNDASYLSIKDSESLDTYIQNTLSALYPPFETTAATVLWQLFGIVEKFYKGDGLRCLIDFLVPAKRILQSIQQQTCDNYTGVIFYHEGWPLCIHEKVVVQLASLHRVRLKPGDFYFQIYPLGKQSAKLVLKCLSKLGTGVEEVTIPETMYGCIFTSEFLENVNCANDGFPLQNCLLTTGTAVYRTPWKNIINPIFVPTAETILQNYSGAYLNHLINNNSNSKGMTQTMESSSSHTSSTSNETSSTVIEVSTFTGKSRKHGLESSSGESLERPFSESSLEGQDADDSTISPKGSSLDEEATQCTDECKEFLESSPHLQSRRSSAKSIAFSTDLSSPCQRRQTRDSSSFESRRLFRKSYLEALQNPMHLGSSSEESLTEEKPQPQLEANDLNEKNKLVHLQICEKQTFHALKLSPKKHFNKTISADNNVTPTVKSVSTNELHKLAVSHISNRRRSLSVDKLQKKSSTKDYRSRMYSDDPSNANSKMSLNGFLGKDGSLDSGSNLSINLQNDRCCKDNTDVFMNNHSNPIEDSKQLISDSRESYVESKDLLSPSHADEIFHKWPNQIPEVNKELLQSGIIYLPGNRDRSGRAILQICAKNAIWLKEYSTSIELLRLLIYYYMIPRKEVRDLGLVILMDARRSHPIPELFKAFVMMQNSVPYSIQNILILVDKESTFRPEKDPSLQYEVLSSLKALHKHIDYRQLTTEFDGLFLYNHDDWICFRRKIEPFITDCREAIIFLQNSICSLNMKRNLNSVQEVADLLEKHRTMMKLVLEDPLLVSLRLEGGTNLARLRKDEFLNTDDYRDAMETITTLYNQVDEEVHTLVLLSNKSLQELEKILEIKKVEECFEQIKLWFETEKHTFLAPLDDETLSLEVLKTKQEQYKAFNDTVVLNCEKGFQLMDESKSQNPEGYFQNFKTYLDGIKAQTEKRKTELEILLNLYEFYETANKWMVHCNDYLKQLTTEVKYTPSAIQDLQMYHQEAKKVSAENFHKVNEMVLSLASEKELKQWNILWLKCQQTRHCLEDALQEAHKSSYKNNLLRTVDNASIKIDLKVENGSSLSISDFGNDLNGIGFNNNNNNIPLIHQERDSLLPGGVLNEIKTNQRIDLHSQYNEVLCSQDASFLLRREEVLKDIDQCGSVSCYSEPVRSPTSRHKKHPLKKLLKKTQSFEFSQPESIHSDIHRHVYTGVHIKGLEIAGSVSSERSHFHKFHSKSPQMTRNRSLSSPSHMHLHAEEQRTRGRSKLHHIMDEMITTEREYVRSLGYIIDNYFPEMERLDLPQDLRGKRNIIFGNLEKLYDFHSQYFLKELDHCIDCPLRVSNCFLKHEEQFGMYALYSKNKPQSDTLLISHGNAFFKDKQQDLGDKMDLASYLLKPIQRMSKYALLLKDMIKECCKTQEQELSDLRAAEEMVKFQLRHGNDLLAMDAIRGCDVNLKEQGPLRCQDEFIVWCGRRKYLRHVFLFEDLILFSKTKKIDGGYDIYIYKQSYKTAEIGMTENIGDSGLRFEIWFRRRKSQDTFIIQASSAEVKSTWTDIIGKILWRQALRNRELRMQEMVSMGIGNKPFMDIKPSDAAINDRAIDYMMKSSETRTRASIAVSTFDHSTPFKRPHSTISDSSTSSSSSQSSSSLLGSLNLHVCSSPPHSTLPGPPAFHWSYEIEPCIEEDELELETGSQPSMITESSESSQCTSGESVSGLSSLSNSAHTRLSHVSPETFSDEAASTSSSKPPSQCTSPVLPDKNSRIQTGSNHFVTANKPSQTLDISPMV
ncbi:pleckstrin homology domain-containing family G member 4B isoform X2 [Bombina bombina]|uniref:pleckstrin homology domain-containing family G member 4B isoform X2 n=1 Tax=Bombina bombina TaxID=8345 RepID=UPI00235A4D90|nr:pleckstrin homology domain-containing family G member 4B isoform X2 [Bombina bombina]